MTESVKIEFNISGAKLDNFLNDLKVNFKDLNVQVNKVDQSSNTAFTNISKQIRNISVVSLTQGLQNLRNTLRDISGPGIEFNQSVADLSAITGIAGEELDDLSSTARKVGKESALGAVQATEAFKLLASQISVDKMGIDGLKTLQKETIALSQASGMDLPTAANAMASAINQFGLEATDASRVINVLAAGSKYGAAEIPQLAETFKVAGAAASAAGMDIEGLAGAAEVLSKNAMTGSEAGTHLRNILVRMQTNLGVDFRNTSMSEALQALQPQLENTEYLVKTFGESSLGAAQFLIKNADYVDEMTQSVTNTNVAYEQAAVRNETLQHKLAKSKAFFDDIKIGVTELTGALLPHLEGVFGVAQGVSTLMPLVHGLTGAYRFLRVAKNRDTIATMINTGVTKVLAIGTGVLAAATTGLGVAFRFMMGPVGWIITGLGLVAAGVVYAWNHFEGFRKAIYGIWGAVKKVFSNIAKFIGDMLQPFFDAVGFIMEGKWGAAAKALGKGILNLATGQFKFIGALISGDITDGVAEEYAAGAEKGSASFAASQEKRKKKKEQGELVSGIEEALANNEKKTQAKAGSPFSLGTTTDDITKPRTTSEGTSGSGRNLNTRIENLVGTVNVYVEGNLNDVRGKIRRVLNEELTGAVRDFEVAISS